MSECVCDYRAEVYCDEVTRLGVEMRRAYEFAVAADGGGWSAYISAKAEHDAHLETARLRQIEAELQQ